MGHQRRIDLAACTLIAYTIAPRLIVLCHHIFTPGNDFRTISYTSD